MNLAKAENCGTGTYFPCGLRVDDDEEEEDEGEGGFLLTAWQPVALLRNCAAATLFPTVSGFKSKVTHSTQK